MGKRKNRRPLSRHHRHPQSLGGTDEPNNIIMVPVTKHRAWHTLFNNLPPEQIAKTISETWISTDYVMIAVHKEKGLSIGQLCSLIKT